MWKLTFILHDDKTSIMPWDHNGEYKGKSIYLCHLHMKKGSPHDSPTPVVK